MTLPKGTTIVSVDFSPDGKTIAVGDADGQVFLVDVASRSVAAGPARVDDPGSYVARRVQPGRSDARRRRRQRPGLAARRRNAGARRSRRSSTTRPSCRTSTSARDGRLAVALYRERGVDLGCCQPPKVLTLETGDEGVLSVSFSPDGRYVATGGVEGKLRIWDAQTGKLVGAPFTAHAGDLVHISFSPDSRTVATSGADGVVRLWDSRHAASSARGFRRRRTSTRSATSAPTAHGCSSSPPPVRGSCGR